MEFRGFFWTNEYLMTLGLFLLVFLIVPMIVNKKWYGQNPREEFLNEKDQNELIKNTLEHYKYLESTSYVLSGSALVGLTFIISLNYNELNLVESTITFFSIAFILEIISAFSFHDLRKNFWGHLGQVLQYGGMISILMGFEVFIFSQITSSLLLQIIFPIGMTVIIYLAFRELNAKILFLGKKKK